VARLNEAIFVIERFLKPEYSIPEQELSSIRTALDNYIKVIEEVSNIKVSEDPPKWDSLELLAEKGMLKENWNSILLNKDKEHNRAMFLTLIERDGWKWNDVTM